MNNSNIFLLFFPADVGACFADYTVTDRNPSQAFKPQLPAVVIIEVNLKRHLTLSHLMIPWRWQIGMSMPIPVTQVISKLPLRPQIQPQIMPLPCK